MEKLTIENKGKTAIVTIDNPPMNVLSRKVVQELEEAFMMIEESPDILAVILTGKGTTAFMAGADIKEFPNWIHLEQKDMKEVTEETHRVFNTIEKCSKPTIAVLNGLTLGGGCELTLTCDIRIAERHAKIGLPEVKLGLFPGAGGTQRLPRLIGKAKAKELMFLGDTITAEEAHRLGMVNQVVESEKGLETALAMADKLTGLSLEAISRIKRAVEEGTELPLEQGLELESTLFAEVFRTEDVKEGVQAFIEKRKPAFKHR